MRTQSPPFLAACLLAMVSTMPDLSAVTNPALSNRTFVDTRKSTDANPDPLEGVPKLIDSPQLDGRRFISYEMAQQALTRPKTGNVTVYLQLQMPEFALKKGGWGASQAGMGTFYGLEMKTFSQLTYADSIRYKIGGAVPTPDTPATDWIATTFNTIINIDLQRTKQTYYFKIVLASGSYGIDGVDPGPLTVSARFQSARLSNVSGGPVTALDTSQPLWIVAHGRVDGEYSFRRMNKAVRQAVGSTQVVCLDWAAVAADKESFLGGGRYMINLGKNLAGLLKEESIAGSNVNWVGHSWGTLIGYETAKAMGYVYRFVALDPATAAFGDYDDSLVNFSKVSAISSGIKGGNIVFGTFGSETRANTCSYSIRLFSEVHVGDFKDPYFYHKLPRAWFIHSIYTSTNPYWSFFHGVMLRSQAKPTMPADWGSNFTFKVGAFDFTKFDLECYGDTTYSNESADFVSHEFLHYNRSGVSTEARATKNTDGTTKDDRKNKYCLLVWKS